MLRMTCRICDQEKDEDAFYLRRSNGRRFTQCIACDKARVLAQDRASGRNPAINNRKKYPEKHAARLAFQTALRRGDLVRPSACQECGWKGDIEGHHEDYTKHMEVEWLCTACHGLRHRTITPVPVPMQMAAE